MIRVKTPRGETILEIGDIATARDGTRWRLFFDHNWQQYQICSQYSGRCHPLSTLHELEIVRVEAPIVEVSKLTAQPDREHKPLPDDDTAALLKSINKLLAKCKGDDAIHDRVKAIQERLSTTGRITIADKKRIQVWWKQKEK